MTSHRRLVSASLSLGGLLLGAGLPFGFALPLGLPAARADNSDPARLSTGSGVWSVRSEAFQQFLQTGQVRDRGLEGLIDGSGWTPYELQLGLTQTYPVQVAGVERFLSSEAGVIWLKNQTRSYVPFAGLSNYRVQALRSAILADAADGQISAAGIMANLPTDFRLARLGPYDGVQNVCAELRCEGNDQCTSLLSWYVFLPACLQANAMTTRVDEVDFTQLETVPRRRQLNPR